MDTVLGLTDYIHWSVLITWFHNYYNELKVGLAQDNEYLLGSLSLE